MSREDRETWDRRWAERDEHAGLPPDAFLSERLAELPRGRALDLGAGEGRNALLLAASGWRVDALDVSAVGLSRLAAEARRRGLPVRCAVLDLERWAPPRETYDLVLGVDFHLRSLVPAIREALRRGGAYLAAQHVAGRHRELRPEWRLEWSDLEAAFAPSEIRVWREGPARRAFLAVRLR